MFSAAVFAPPQRALCKGRRKKEGGRKGKGGRKGSKAHEWAAGTAEMYNRTHQSIYIYYSIASGRSVVRIRDT